jgi:hypothetical protein
MPDNCMEIVCMTTSAKQHADRNRGLEDGGSIHLRNVGILLQHYTISQPRSPRIKFSRS